MGGAPLLTGRPLKTLTRYRSPGMFFGPLLASLPLTVLKSMAPADREIVRSLSAWQIWANAEWKRWRLFLLFNVFAKRLEAFICDLGQRDAIDLIDPVDPNL